MKPVNNRELILLVEDSSYMRHYLTDLLSAHYNVRATENGTEAFRLAIELSPSLIISDIILPGINGLDLLTMVRSQREIAKVPFILLSSRTDEESIVKGLETGADDYLLKPIRAPQLLAKIKTHLELYHFRRKELENELQAEKNNNEQKDRFIEIASHELKTPLTSLYGYMQLLDDPDLTDDQLRQFYVKKSLDQLKVMTNLVNNLTNITKFQLQHVLDDFSRIEISEFIEGIINKLQSNYVFHQLSIEAEKGLSVKASPFHLEQVIGNYISNAVKYSPDSEVVKVVVRNNGNGFAEVCVKDRGIGIPKEKIKNLFKRFYRADPIKISGFGLGLYHCAEIIKNHGGRTWAESAYGVGSSFYFTIPLKEG